MKCTVQEAKSPVKISSGSIARRDLITALKGYCSMMHGQQNITLLILYLQQKITESSEKITTYTLKSADYFHITS
jgi:hypothetical protein